MSDNETLVGFGCEGLTQRDFQHRDLDEFKLKVNVPSFNGNLGIKNFLDWIAEIERFFEYMEILEDKQVKLMAYRLKKRPSFRYEQL